MLGVSVVVGRSSRDGALRMPYVPALLLAGCLFCALALVLLVR